MATTEEKSTGNTKIERAGLTAADAVWVATAVLERGDPASEGFDRSAIAEKVRDLRLTDATDQTVWQHIDQHCVADKEPNPGRTRMLSLTGSGQRRVYLPSDPTHPKRGSARCHPVWTLLPDKYRDLEQWYLQRTSNDVDPLLALRGSGAKTWAGIDAVDYINRMREGLD